MNHRRDQDNRSNRLKLVAGLMAMVFAVTLAIIIGSRLSDESLAVLAGAACGVGAAIPTSLLILAVSRRRNEPRREAPPQQAYPPIVVVAPPSEQVRPTAWNALPPSLTTPRQRTFTVVGGTEDEDILLEN